MFQLKLPMAAEDLSILVSSEDGVGVDSLLSIGISENSVNDAYKWLHLMHGPFAKLVGDEYDVTPINEFVETLCGLWQLRVLSHLGGSYIKKLKEDLLSRAGKENFDTCEFARAIYNAMPKRDDALDTKVIFQNSNILIDSVYTYYHPTNVTYSESKRVSEEAILTVTLSAYQMITAMAYIIIQNLDSIANSDTEDALYFKKRFSSLAVAVEAEHTPPMYPLLLLVDKINTTFKKHRREETKQRQSKLGLRLI